jgi:hypothetical protein
MVLVAAQPPRSPVRGGTMNLVKRTVDGVSGNDTISGGAGFDVCLVDEGDDVIQCERVFKVPVE